MEINVDKSIVSKSIKHYGEGMQSVVCMEELSELSQAISKEIRGIGDRSNLVEEMADVIICLEILKQIFAVTNVEIEEWVKFKQGRNLKRIKYEKKIKIHQLKLEENRRLKMAERRMFTKKVTDDDNFMALSSSAQALYLHLSMSADDDGFCNQVSVSMFKAHASVADLQQLLEKDTYISLIMV